MHRSAAATASALSAAFLATALGLSLPSAPAAAYDDDVDVVCFDYEGSSGSETECQTIEQLTAECAVVDPEYTSDVCGGLLESRRPFGLTTSSGDKGKAPPRQRQRQGQSRPRQQRQRRQQWSRQQWRRQWRRLGPERLGDVLSFVMVGPGRPGPTMTEPDLRGPLRRSYERPLFLLRCGAEMYEALRECLGGLLGHRRLCCHGPRSVDLSLGAPRPYDLAGIGVR